VGMVLLFILDGYTYGTPAPLNFSFLLGISALAGPSSYYQNIKYCPDGMLADYARIVELLMEFGPNLHMPHSRAMGGDLFELRPRGQEGIGRVFYCFVIS
jgi:hypothetical protein